MAATEMDAKQNNPRRRRPADRPAEIIEAAGHVFSHQGYDGATTREIAALAGVSEGTLYNYFSSKREILLAVIDSISDDWRRDHNGIQADSLEEAISQVLARRMRSAKEQPLTILTLQQAMLDPEVAHYLETVIATAQETVSTRFRALIDAGIMRAVDPVVAEQALSGLMMALTIGTELGTRGGRQDELSPEEMSCALADVLINGLRAR
jgi:AcrR family transcriptional regulator